ncbi:MAG TPA: hypothetical protein PKM65_03265 [Spirochaetota bacterium]|nr:hypothetical protein [Spirochaetota bacterium]
MVKWFSSIKERLPAWSWAFILLGIMMLVIIIPIALIYVISHFEGVASLIFLVIGWSIFGRIARSVKPSPLIMGGVVAFYALMGMAIDQMGNRIYNIPIGLTCPAGTTFHRNVVTIHPLPGRTDFVQNFECFDAAGKAVHRIAIPVILAVRLGEYVLIAHLLLGIRKLMLAISESRRRSHSGATPP